MSAPGEAAEAPLKGPTLALVSGALALATFMQVLDSTIANVSIPTIAGNLGTSTDQGTWIITAFAVSNGVSLPLTGWVTQRYGVVKTFVLAVLLFTLASLMCGMAWSLSSLVAFRILQGAVSGPMIPGSQTLLISIFPAAKRGTALTIWSVTAMVAPICGPLFGGYISDNWSWRWIFFINLPVGVICTFVCWRVLASRDTARRIVPIDKIGFILLVIWVGALQVMLDQGKDADWFASSTITTLALVAAIGFAVWLVWELTEAHPIVDLSFFRSRNFVCGTIALCFGFGVYFANALLLPLWLQTQLGYTASWAGRVLAPSGAVSVLLAPLSTWIMARVDARWTATGTLLILAASYFWRAGFTPNPSFLDLVLPIVLQGCAVGTFMVSLFATTLNGIPPARLPAASGLVHFGRITLSGFAASITTTFWDRRAALHQTRLSETVGVYDSQFWQTMKHMREGGLSVSQALGQLTNGLINQAYLMSSIDFFWISGWVSLLLLPALWLTRRSVAGGTHAVAD